MNTFLNIHQIYKPRCFIIAEGVAKLLKEKAKKRKGRGFGGGNEAMDTDAAVDEGPGPQRCNFPFKYKISNELKIYFSFSY